VPRFDYHIVFSGKESGSIKFIHNVKDVLEAGWDRGFRLDSHLLNKNILKNGEASFVLKDGSATMLVKRTMKHTPEEMVEMYMSGKESKLDYVDSYLTANPGLRRKVGPLLKVKSKASMRLRPAPELEQALEVLAKVPVPGIDA
jgi:hypothetical protein